MSNGVVKKVCYSKEYNKYTIAFTILVSEIVLGENKIYENISKTLSFLLKFDFH